MPSPPSMPHTAPLYDASFYQAQSGGSERSAQVVLPLLQSWISPQSVIDVGCGVGTWLRVWQQLGVAAVQGIDGPYVDRSQLRIDEALFTPHNLEQPLPTSLPRHTPVDLVMSLEVAEHLPASRADSFVADLVRLSPVVLFSAAIPHQGGKGHINEQWPDYWASRFAQHGYVAIDALRARLWNHSEVAWWYAQNLVLYVDQNHLNQLPNLAALLNPEQPLPLRLIHPKKFLALASASKQTLGRKLYKRFKRLISSP
jgi:SAM-dependent methyltransferase